MLYFLSSSILKVIVAFLFFSCDILCLLTMIFLYILAIEGILGFQIMAL